MNLFDQLRTGIEVLLARHKENGFDACIEVTVHLGHLELVLEIGARSASANKDVSIQLHGQVYQ